MPEQWRKAIIVPLYKGKGRWNYCNSSWIINLLNVPEKVYGRVFNERIMKITA